MHLCVIFVLFLPFTSFLGPNMIPNEHTSLETVFFVLFKLDTELQQKRV